MIKCEIWWKHNTLTACFGTSTQACRISWGWNFSPSLLIIRLPSEQNCRCVIEFKAHKILMKPAWDWLIILCSWGRMIDIIFQRFHLSLTHWLLLRWPVENWWKGGDALRDHAVESISSDYQISLRASPRNLTHNKVGDLELATSFAEQSCRVVESPKVRTRWRSSRFQMWNMNLREWWHWSILPPSRCPNVH